MSKLNEKYLEYKFEWYKHLFTLFFAVEVGCIAWVVANYSNAIQNVVILAFMTILAVTCTLGILIGKVIKYIKLVREQ